MQLTSLSKYDSRFERAVPQFKPMVGDVGARFCYLLLNLNQQSFNTGTLPFVPYVNAIIYSLLMPYVETGKH